MGNCGNCGTETKKLEVRISRRYRRGGSAASAHRLSAALVRKSPSANLRECD